MNYFFSFLLGCFFFSFGSYAQPAFFPLVTEREKVTIVYDKFGALLDSVSAHLLADDIKRVSSYRPWVTTNLAGTKGNIIVIGSASSFLMQRFSGRAKTLFSKLQNQWECYGLMVLDKPAENISKALLVAGSDVRGTAYGVFSLSEKIGVSPWWWWADVPEKKQKNLFIRQEEIVSAPPSVKYRGIFINDEDWGLLPWAANTFEPEKKNIGPKTYAKVFELLLRLKANLIWPAMHPGTQPFFTNPENREVAKAFSIIIGSSHAEPMLRNNVGEWIEKESGKFNYITNREKVYQYWEERVKETGGMETMFSLGMRGVHDSGMEGVKSTKEAVPLLEKIFADQRGLLHKYRTEKVESVPQVFTAYKEVLDIYDSGLQLPDDVTLVWPDDNYGYIKRLNTPDEKKRLGGTGIYYHASYWGRPHDYLWLGTTHPSLIQSEMMKAYNTGADRLWVVNVGDIKPLEYSTQLFLDMAYRAAPFQRPGYVQVHQQHWLKQIF
ncbi:MAG TPA: glycosyl hydrolase 115 family protein, partial [Flavisolibacter sp.]